MTAKWREKPVASPSRGVAQNWKARLCLLMWRGSDVDVASHLSPVGVKQSTGLLSVHAHRRRHLETTSPLSSVPLTRKHLLPGRRSIGRLTTKYLPEILSGLSAALLALSQRAAMYEKVEPEAVHVFAGLLKRWQNFGDGLGRKKNCTNPECYKQKSSC